MKFRFLLAPPHLDRKRYLRTATIRSTILSMLISMTITPVVEYFTPNPDYLWGMIIAGLVPLLVVPPLTYRHHLLLHELQKSKQKIQELSRTDELTKLANRRYFFEQAEHHFYLAERHQHPISILIIDLDYFKSINDRFGHQVGDQVLAHTAAILKESIRSTDILARYGGEEFVLLMPQTAAENTIQFCQRLKKTIACRQIDRSNLPAVTLSMGIASSEKCGYDLEEILFQADKAMYQAKNRGRNNYVIADQLKPGQ